MNGNYPLPSSDASKKDRIIARLVTGSETDEEIARGEDTSTQYVRKVKCELNKTDDTDTKKHEKVSRTASPDSSSTTGNSEKSGSRTSVPSAASGRVPIGLQSPRMQPLDENQRKLLWADFKDAKTPIECVIKYGYHPLTIRAEYEAYLGFLNIEPTRHQDYVLRYLAAHQGQLQRTRPNDFSEYKKIMSEYATKKYITKEQSGTLFKMVELASHDEGVDDVAYDFESTPEGWVRPLCNICLEPLGGLVGDGDDPLAKAALESVKTFVHTKCQEAQKEQEEST